MVTEETARKQLHTLHQEGSALVEEIGAEQLRLRKLFSDLIDDTHRLITNVF